jgi:hypothetical protein
MSYSTAVPHFGWRSYPYAWILKATWVGQACGGTDNKGTKAITMTAAHST